ncbi:hypothetical protein D917_04802 [Trichinella nativa]|uniref:Uncharacterized protein n=1 Tax=Trichinella nativa TaxID=6335 RepID=A0A1Y3EYJ7_9BILA|nr:hypothetical protein D917_04802 [Trichinella nativa]
MLKKTETLGPDGVEYYYSDPHKDSIGQTATTTATQQTTVGFHLTNKQTNEHDTKIFFLSRYCLFADTPETLLTLSKSKAETKVPGARQKAFFQITAINTILSNIVNFSLLACTSKTQMSRPQQHSPALVRNEQKFSLGNQLTEGKARGRQVLIGQPRVLSTNESCLTKRKKIIEKRIQT